MNIEKILKNYYNKKSYNNKFYIRKYYDIKSNKINFNYSQCYILISNLRIIFLYTYIQSFISLFLNPSMVYYQHSSNHSFDKVHNTD